MKKNTTIILIMFFFASVFAAELRINSKHREWVQNNETFPFMITVYPNAPNTQQNPAPLQVLYAIDVSERLVGSIRQEFINGGIELVRRLADTDYFGIILYSEYSRTLLPLSEIGTVGRNRINSLLSEISTERGRDPLSALERIVSEFSQHQGRRNEGKSLVLTILGEADEDGEGNQYAKHLVAAMKELDVTIYTVGHGDDFNEDAAIYAAERTGGRAYFTGRDHHGQLRNRFEALFKHINAPNTKNINIEFLARDGVKITNFGDTVLSNVRIPKISENDTVYLFFEAHNRPRRNSDVDVDFDFENVAIRSNLSGNASFKINLTRGNSSSFSENAERIVRHQLLFNMAESIDELKIGDRRFRRDYAEGFRRLLETRLGQIRNEINSREIFNFFSEMVALYDMINGGTASNALIAKTVKYLLHYSSFPE
jgi:hypothetical protein